MPDRRRLVDPEPGEAPKDVRMRGGMPPRARLGQVEKGPVFFPAPVKEAVDPVVENVEEGLETAFIRAGDLLDEIGRERGVDAIQPHEGRGHVDDWGV